MKKTNTEEKRKIFSKEKFADVFTKENIAKAVFVAFAAFSILAVFAIIFYILYASIPAFREIGFFKFIFGSEWYVDRAHPENSSYGILPMILTSLVLTVFSVALGGTLAVFTAVFMVYYCPKWLKKIYTQIVNLLAGIPSLVYGYFGLQLLKPLILVVDNDEDICLNIKDVMDDTGVAVDYATSGKQAIQMADDAYNKHNYYQIILLDWKMPEMDGIETAKAL